MIPQNYSRDIAERCQTLIENLLPLVHKGLPGDQAFGGPLSTTLLLALATPMIVLPAERIVKAADGVERAGDDRGFDAALAQRIVDAFGDGKTFAQAPFRAGEHWSYVPNFPRFNIARTWPAGLLHQLDTQQAIIDAENAPAKQIILDLRNALGHGGITYLDAQGRQGEGEAGMLAFAGNARNGRTAPFNILRISEEGFRRFLRSWSRWIAEKGVQDVLNRMNPLTV